MNTSRIRDLAKQQGKSVTYICKLIDRPKYYLNDVVENQGKLFDFVAQNFPNMDTEDFINVYI